MMRKAERKVRDAMHEFNAGTLRIGRSDKRVKSAEQPIAIGLPEAGAKVPPPKRKRNR
jgi:Family of unknown function (DUF6496)